MAYVTFIVGNGLDLSMGLMTSYRSFYEYVEARHLHPDNRIYKAIQESPESWADFELSLGTYTSYIENLPEKDRKRESVKFHEELEELMDDLADYLDKQEKGAELIDDMNLTSEGFFEELPIGQRDRISVHLFQTPPSFEFITLNYTHTLDEVLSNNRTSLSNQRIALGAPLHIHGDLSENLTVGVSDESQLSSGMSGTEKDDLIKPSLIYSMNDGRIDAMYQLIQKSSVIVLFGTSIGETDKYIWQLLADWLVGATNRYVIIHKHDVDYTDSVRRSSRRQKQFTSNVQDKLLRYSGLDGNGITELRNRVFVIHNTKKLFTSK
jgi:hypothetical protein